MDAKFHVFSEIFFLSLQIGIHSDSSNRSFDPGESYACRRKKSNNNFITVVSVGRPTTSWNVKFVFQEDGGGGGGGVNGESEGREMFLINHSCSITRGRGFLNASTMIVRIICSSTLIIRKGKRYIRKWYHFDLIRSSGILDGARHG